MGHSRLVIVSLAALLGCLTDVSHLTAWAAPSDDADEGEPEGAQIIPEGEEVDRDDILMDAEMDEEIIDSMMGGLGQPEDYEFEQEMEELELACTQYEFPSQSFASQPDPSKVYLIIDEVANGPFKDVDLTKYASAFGVRIVGHEAVDDAVILHMVNLVAQFLDNDQDGIVDRPAVQEQLMERMATMFIVSDQSYTSFLLSSDDKEGFPVELKYCPYSFDYEEASKIQPNGDPEAVCPDDLFAKDRSVAFASDHLVGRGWPKLLVDEDGDMAKDPIFLEFTDHYMKAIEEQKFDLEKTGCPEDDQDYCGMVMFASWSITTYLGVDKCWCQSVGAWKLCDKESAMEEYPKLMQFIETYLVKIAPDGMYSPKDESVIVRSSKSDRPVAVGGSGRSDQIVEEEVKESDEINHDSATTAGEAEEDDARVGDELDEDEL